MAQAKKVLNIGNVPKNIVNLEYAVRGAIVARSWELQKILNENPSSLPFQEILPANIGNPQAVGQQPLTFNRQVIAGLAYPPLVHNGQQIFPTDVVERVNDFLGTFPSYGAYSHSKGIERLRDRVAEWLTKRDDCATDPDHIFLTDGASAAVRAVLELLIEGEKDGIMVPIPQYPLYSASIARHGGTMVPYYLKESAQWSLEKAELKRAIDEFRKTGGECKGIVVINPGNPTGAVLTRKSMEEVCDFCLEEGLVLMADEVYQENVYGDKPFLSFRKLAAEKGLPIELFSLHSASKGLSGECGMRGGLMHLHNIDPKVTEQIYKLFSVALCSNTLGQAMMTSLLLPPTGPSRTLYDEEKCTILSSLKEKAIIVADALNQMEGVSCQPVDGAMYAFPTIAIPQKACDEAKSKGVAPDFMYCMQVLEQTGLMVVPGSGFGQAPGTYHFRITILPQKEKLITILSRLAGFHQEFIKKYT
eukprot:Platyproteum_vivax@DN276_c0_g1_i1.p1